MKNPKQHHLLSANPSIRTSSIKSRFTRGLVRALIRMKRKNNYQPCSRREMFRRYSRVKIAADKSMAVAVGSRRAWSRAMLWRIYHHHHHHQTWRYNQLMIKKRLAIDKKQKKKKKKLKKEEDDRQEEERGFGKAGELRKLVPGGEAMDLCCLLDETAHYIKCLVTQVQVMRSVDQFYSL